MQPLLHDLYIQCNCHTVLSSSESNYFNVCTWWRCFKIMFHCSSHHVIRWELGGSAHHHLPGSLLAVLSWCQEPVTSCSISGISSGAFRDLKVSINGYQLHGQKTAADLFREANCSQSDNQKTARLFQHGRVSSVRYELLPQLVCDMWRFWLNKTTRLHLLPGT